MIFFNVAGISQEPESAKKIIYMTTGYWGDLFDINNPLANRDNCLEPLCAFRDEAKKFGYDVRQVSPFDPLEEFELLIVFEVFPDQIHAVSKYPKEKMVLFLWEPPSVLPQNYDPLFHQFFSKIYTWHDDLVDNKKYFKLYYPIFHPMVEKRPSFDEKKLSALVCCNKNSYHPNELYSKRRELIHFFEKNHPEDFDLYGKWWGTDLKVYKGPIGLKVDTLKNYKFSFAYENVKGVSGYVTEKIFDCFHAGSVPIYWGAPNVTKYVPSNCFISREDFKNNEELYLHLKNMSQQEHENYISNIQKFMKSDQAKLYSKEHFVAMMIDLIKSTSPASKNQELQ